MSKLGFCNNCKKIVPVVHRKETGKEYLDKLCPDCGTTSTLISNDSQQYRWKRNLMADRQYEGCSMKCLECTHKPPTVVLIETTNRCNMKCPICITNVPSMGFQFEPYMEYFDRIFRHYSAFSPRPPIHLFGGEPTMREDLFEIIKLAKFYGLEVRINTNGLKLADKAYAERLVETGVIVHLSFDGLNKEMYKKLRNNVESADLKLKALENLAEIKKSGKKVKVVLMTVIDKEFNGKDIISFFDYCHSNPQIRVITLMCLIQVWGNERFDYQPERTTQEDVERLVNNAIDGKVDFLPLGMWEFKNLAKVLKTSKGIVPFSGIHPNCESGAYLLRKGDKFVSLNFCLRYGIAALFMDIRKLDEEISSAAAQTRIGIRLKVRVYTRIGMIVLKHFNILAATGEKGFKAFGRILRVLGRLIIGHDSDKVLAEETILANGLQILLMPFEDDCTAESERLKECSSSFAYIDVKTDTIKTIPFCIWEKYKKNIMKEVAGKYNKAEYALGLSHKRNEDEKDKAHV